MTTIFSFTSNACPRCDAELKHYEGSRDCTGREVKPLAPGELCARCVAATLGCPVCGVLPGVRCTREGIPALAASWAIHPERRATR